MTSDSGRIIFYDQNLSGAALPEGGDNGREAARLRVVPVGVYELSFRQQPHFELQGTLLFNAGNPHALQKQFEIVEDVTELERTLTIRRTSDATNLESLELIPLDWRENPIEFTQLAVSEIQRTIRYQKDPPVESLKLKISVNVFEVESINATFWANGQSYFPGQLTALIKRSEDIRIDRLDKLLGGARKIEDHLLAFFNLLLEKAPGRTFDFECSYRYQIGDGGPHALLPVLVPQKVTLATASELFSTLQPVLNNWYQSSLVPKGVFDFGVKVYAAGSDQLPILHLTGIILPIDSIAGWSHK